MDPLLVAQIALPPVALGLGVWLGRWSSAAARRARALEAELEMERAARAAALAEKREREAELARAREEAEAYRKRVIEHFYGTGEQLRALALQYRSVFEHLAEDARALCPESWSALQGSLAAPAIEPAAGSADADLETDEEESARAHATELRGLG